MSSIPDTIQLGGHTAHVLEGKGHLLQNLLQVDKPFHAGDEYSCNECRVKGGIFLDELGLNAMTILFILLDSKGL